MLLVLGHLCLPVGVLSTQDTAEGKGRHSYSLNCSESVFGNVSTKQGTSLRGAVPTLQWLGASFSALNTLSPCYGEQPKTQGGFGWSLCLVLAVHPIRHHGVLCFSNLKFFIFFKIEKCWIFQLHRNNGYPHSLRVNPDCSSLSHPSRDLGLLKWALTSQDQGTEDLRLFHKPCHQSPDSFSTEPTFSLLFLSILIYSYSAPIRFWLFHPGTLEFVHSFWSCFELPYFSFQCLSFMSFSFPSIHPGLLSPWLGFLNFGMDCPWAWQKWLCKVNYLPWAFLLPWTTSHRISPSRSL